MFQPFSEPVKQPFYTSCGNYSTGMLLFSFDNVRLVYCYRTNTLQGLEAGGVPDLTFSIRGKLELFRGS